MISVTGARDFLRHDPDDPTTTGNVRDASLVLANKQVGALATSAQVIQRLTRLNKLVEELVREKKRSATKGSGSSKSGGGGRGGLGVEDLLGWELFKKAGRGAGKFAGRFAKVAGPIGALIGAAGMYSDARKTGKVSMLDAVLTGAGAGVLAGPYGALIGAGLAVAGAFAYNNRASIEQGWRNTVSLSLRAVDKTLKWGKATWSGLTTRVKNAITVSGQYIQDAWEAVRITASKYKNQISEWLERQGSNLSEWLSTVAASLRASLNANNLRTLAMEWLERLRKWVMDSLGFGGGNGKGSSASDALARMSGGSGNNPSAFNRPVKSGDMSNYLGSGSPNIPEQFFKGIDITGGYAGAGPQENVLNPSQRIGSGAAQFGFGDFGQSDEGMMQLYGRKGNSATGTLSADFGKSGIPGFVQQGAALPLDRDALPGYAVSSEGAGNFGLNPNIRGTGQYGTIDAQYKGAWTKPGEGGHLSPKEHYEYLKSIGASDKEALMLTGAAASESSFNYKAVHDNGTGYGMYGHNTKRIDMRSMGWQQQASSALREMRNMPRVMDAIKNAKSASDLAIAQAHFERPRGYTKDSPTSADNFNGRAGTIARFSNFASGQSRNMGNAQAVPQQAHSNTSTVSNDIQLNRPDKYTGTIKLGDKEFHYVTGGAGRGSSPYGDLRINRFTPGEQRAAEGRSWRTNAFEIDDAFDPKTGDKRTGVLLHPSEGYGTHGCFGINKDEWPSFEKELRSHMDKNGPMNLRVNPDGSATIMPYGDPSRAYTKKPNASAADMLGTKTQLGQAISVPEGAMQVASAEEMMSPTTLEETGRAPPGPESKDVEASQSSAGDDTSAGVKSKRINMDDIPIQNPDINLTVVAHSDTA